jgi:glycosyltransferase involved in cell wall biosynthesis
VNTIEMYFHHAAGFYRSVDRYIAVSDFYRSKMIEFGFRPDQVVHIPNYIDCSRFRLSDSDRGYGLYFGRLSEEKGVATLLRALAKTPERPFLIVGTGPDEAELKRLAGELKLSGTKFLGFKRGEELNDLIGGAAFTVIPSEWYENCPMSVLESFALGKPVIGARIGGIPELVAEGVDGFTFESGNAEALAEKMNLLWDDPERRRSMGLKGRLKVEHEYTPEKQYNSIMAVYRELCDNQERQ